MIFRNRQHRVEAGASDSIDTAVARPSRTRRRILVPLTALALGVGLTLAGGTSASAAAPRERIPVAPVAASFTPALNGPQTCSIQTYNGHYLTAVSGGGRTSDVLHTDATRVGSWEKFTLIDSGDGSSPIHYGVRTVYGYYLTAVGGGGRITDVFHSDATWLLGWEKLTFNSLGYGIYDIQTMDGHYVTAVGGGGRTTDTIHTDATRVGSWEKFRVTCGL